jgi:polyhydroxyalkanoate synthesis regulator phasin
MLFRYRAAMPQNDAFRRYLDAGVALSQITRSRLEELVKEFVRTGEVERNRAQDWVEDVVKRSVDLSEALLAQVSNEVSKQLADLGLGNVEEVAKRVSEILGGVPSAARKVSRPAARSAATKTTAIKKAALARTPGVKKAAVKKAPAKKAAVKKAPARKTTARKAPAKKAGA